MKIALLVAYDGTDFRGFARQPNARTIQGVLEEALSQLLRTEVRATGAGRTDAGVHAFGQVVSFDAPSDANPDRIKERLNKRLGPEISIRAASWVPESFDARHSARKRIYEYRVRTSDAPDPFTDRYYARTAGPLKVGSMRRAAKSLVGEHDFSSFCRRGEGSMVRSLRSITIRRSSDEIVVRVVADSFCHQMVRSIVGLLLDIGRGKRAPEEIETILRAKDRAAAGPVAPAKGLTLVEVGYSRSPFPATSS